MINALNKFYKSQDKVILYSNLVSITSTISLSLIFAINYKSLPTQLPLFYSLQRAENYLVNLPQFATLPTLMLLLVLINLIVSWHIHPSQLILKRILHISTAISCALLLTTGLKIIYIFI